MQYSRLSFLQLLTSNDLLCANSLSYDKIHSCKGKLVGIKGQYLIFDDGTVFNVRSFEGYVVQINV
jgi:hypothetical protein